MLTKCAVDHFEEIEIDGQPSVHVELLDEHLREEEADSVKKSTSPKG